MGAVDTILEAIRSDLAAISGLSVEVYQSAPFQPPETPATLPYATCAISFEADGKTPDAERTYSWEFKTLVVRMQLYVVDLAATIKTFFAGKQNAIEAALRADWTLGGNVITIDFEPGWEDVQGPGDRDEMGVSPEMHADFVIQVRYVAMFATGALVTA